MTPTPHTFAQPAPAGNRPDRLTPQEPPSPDRPTTAAVLRCRHVARLLTGTLAGRIPSSMAPLAILFLVQHEGGPLALGGVLCALYGLASAVGQPLLGRLVDRHGQTLITGTAVALTTTALLALAFTRPTDRPAAATTLTVLAGATTPPLEAGLRALWPSVLPDAGRRRAALALDTGSQGLIYIAGPPLTAALAHAFNPATALATAALTGGAGAAIVLTAPPSRAWRSARPCSSLLGPLRHPALRRLFTALSGVGVTLGALTIWSLTAAGRQHTPWLAGAAPAALSAGSVTAGLLLTHRPWTGPLSRQLLGACAAFTASWLPLLTNPAPVAAVVAVLLPGAFLTPLITSAFLTTEHLAPPGTVTEAYAWLITAVGGGQAAGTALAGLTTAHPLILAALPALGAMANLALLLTIHGRLNPT